MKIGMMCDNVTFKYLFTGFPHIYIYENYAIAL